MKASGQGLLAFLRNNSGNVLTRPLGQGLYFSNKGGETYAGAQRSHLGVIREGKKKALDRLKEWFTGMKIGKISGNQVKEMASLER